MTDRLLAALDQVPLIVVVCEGPELRVLSASAPARATLAGREIIGRPIAEVISDLAGQQWVDAYHEVYRTGEPVTGREWRAHLTGPDGSVHEMYANFSITPWHENGVRCGVIGVGTDVTELVRQRETAAEETATLRSVIAALQRELLPSALPVLPGLQVAASYLLADADTAAGGDWFDVFPQRDGRVALVVGDVVGHGVAASGVMGQLRAVLQDRFDDDGGIGDVLAAADRFAGRVPAAHAATVCVALLDPASGEVAYATAGHPPPLVVAVDGSTRYLPGTGGAPLGTGGAFPVRTDRLAVGDLLLLYSDGILERPGRSHRAGAAELAQAAADTTAGRALHDPAATPAERVCTQSVELLVRASGHHDDITLLGAQRVPFVPDLEIELPAEPAALRSARVALAGWLTTLGATDRDVFSLQHALGELMTNAIEHAFDHDDRPAPVTVRATLTADGVVEASVTDHGLWRAPSRQPTRGRGLALTAQLVQSLEVEPGAEGTVARVRQPLSRPARLLDVATPGSPAAAQPADPGTVFRIVEEPGDDESRVRLEGPLDLNTAAHAERELMRRSRGGTVPLTADLSRVTVLSSAGVSMLHRVAGRGPVTLDAAPGTPARDVLELVALLDGYPQADG